MWDMAAKKRRILLWQYTSHPPMYFFTSCIERTTALLELINLQNGKHLQKMSENR